MGKNGLKIYIIQHPHENVGEHLHPGGPNF